MLPLSSGDPSAPPPVVRLTCRLLRDLELSSALSRLMGQRLAALPAPVPVSPPLQPEQGVKAEPPQGTAAASLSSAQEQQVAGAIARLQQAVDAASGVLGSSSAAAGDAAGQQQARQAAYRSIGGSLTRLRVSPG